MNKTKIEWCDRTWNPVTGCLHGCEYCYARKVARRFHGDTPEGRFEPTFHPERFDEPFKEKKPQRVFVVSMGDLFGNWMSVSRQRRVLSKARKAPWHRYIFLTKNPACYWRFYGNGLDYPVDSWLGTTIESDAEMVRWTDLSDNGNLKLGAKRFISFEPLLGPVPSLWKVERKPDWIVVGGMSNGAKSEPPNHDWIDEIAEFTEKNHVPLFIKSNAIIAATRYRLEKYRQFPVGLRDEDMAAIPRGGN